MSKAPKRQKGDPETTGHEWDGIEEFNNPLPRWWVWVFYLTIIWGIGYSVFYPAWPGIRSATAGVLNWSTRANVQADIDAVNEANAPINRQLAEADLTQISANAELNTYAVSAGGAVFRTWCAQCHGAGAAGVQAAGYPNLLDDDWLWGGTTDEIYATIAHGIRNEDDDDARWSEMPAFGEILEPEEIAQAANYVMTLSGGTAMDAAMVDAGKVVYDDNCAACHMEDGSGDFSQGAPALNDQIWLYGGDYDTIVETVAYSRFGVMPNWNSRLTEPELRAVAIYVHQLGGGQ